MTKQTELSHHRIIYEEGRRQREAEILEMIESFKQRINKFGFRTDNRANIIIRRQILEILEEELKSKIKKGEELK